MELTREDVEEILALVRAADVAYFELSTPDFRIVADNRTGADAAALGAPAPPPAVAAPAPSAATTPVVPPQAAAATPPAASAPVPTDQGGQPAQAAGAEATAGGHVLQAPMVGVFYRCPEPGAPPFANVGDTVKQGDTIGLIEVMKTFTSVNADLDGVVVEFLVDDAGFVEFGEGLVRIDPVG